MTRQLKADLMLVLVTLCWGASYYLMDVSLSDMEPFTLNAFRFLVAFIVAAIAAFPKIKTVNRKTIQCSLIIGIVLVFVYTSATFGVKYTSISNAGFICGLTVVFTPILGFIFKKQRHGKKLIVVVLMCLVGTGLLSLDGQFKPAIGDVICLVCAVAYAVDLLFTESFVTRDEVNAFQMGVFQLGFAGIFMLVFAIIFEEPHLPTTPLYWGSAVFLAIFCTGLAFIIQAVAQQYTSAAHVGIIFILEPVFSGIVAFLFAGEILLPRAYVGAALMIGGLFIMEIDTNKDKQP